MPRGSRLAPAWAPLGVAGPSLLASLSEPRYTNGQELMPFNETK